VTRPLSIDRDAAGAWPLLQDALPRGLDVLSVVARRRVDETIASVAAEVSNVVDAALWRRKPTSTGARCCVL
jgi:hypothetical protein